MDVPEGWRKEYLGKFIEFKNGINADKSAYGAGIKFVNVMDIFGNDFLMFNNVRGSMAVTEKQKIDYSVEYGDILFNRTSETYDEIAMTAIYLDKEPIVFGGFVIRGRQKTKTLMPSFSIFCFQSSSIRKEMICRGQGAVRANIGQKDLSKVPILIPPLPEQEKIAEILSVWDQAIEVSEGLIQTSQAQKKALIQQLITAKKRFPSFSKKWNTLELNEVAKIIVSNIDKKTKKTESFVRLCNYMDVYKRDVILSNDVYMKATATKSQIEKFALVKDDVIITKDSETPKDIAIPTYVSSIAPDLLCGYHLAIIRPKKNTGGRFLKFYFEHSHTQYYFASRANGATRFGLTISSIEKASIILPSYEEQQKIGTIIMSAEKEIQKLKDELFLLKQEKLALMQQLLTGKRRVKISKKVDT